MTMGMDAARETAISLLKEGRSAAEVWDTLVWSGVEASAAEALVKELEALRQQAAPPPAARPAPMIGAFGGLSNSNETGSFGWGFAGGIFLNCFAFAYAFLPGNGIGGATKRGIKAGFATWLGVSLLLMLIRAISSG